MTLGEKIAKQRKELNYTQEQLADILGVSRQSISKWESDIAYPETDKLIKMGKLFDCSMDYLLNEDSLDNNNQMVYNIIHKYILGRNTMTRSELIKIICQKNNISLSELARRIGQTPQNFNKKILRNTISDDELSKILLVLNIEYEQKIRFSDGTSIEMKTD